MRPRFYVSNDRKTLAFGDGGYACLEHIQEEVLTIPKEYEFVVDAEQTEKTFQRLSTTMLEGHRPIYIYPEQLEKVINHAKSSTSGVLCIEIRQITIGEKTDTALCIMTPDTAGIISNVQGADIRAVCFDPFSK